MDVDEAVEFSRRVIKAEDRVLTLTSERDQARVAAAQFERQARVLACALMKRLHEDDLEGIPELRRWRAQNYHAPRTETVEPDTRTWSQVLKEYDV